MAWSPFRPLTSRNAWAPRPAVATSPPGPLLRPLGILAHASIVGTDCSKSKATTFTSPAGEAASPLDPT